MRISEVLPPVTDPAQVFNEGGSSMIRMSDFSQVPGVETGPSEVFGLSGGMPRAPLRRTFGLQGLVRVPDSYELGQFPYDAESSEAVFGLGDLAQMPMAMGAGMGVASIAFAAIPALSAYAQFRAIKPEKSTFWKIVLGVGGGLSALTALGLLAGGVMGFAGGAAAEAAAKASNASAQL
jgi:hypothetical protein